MPVKARRSKAKPRYTLTEAEAAWLRGDKLIDTEDFEFLFTPIHESDIVGVEESRAMHRRPTMRELWREYGGEILTQWIELNPGTRPRAWWCFDAPRQAKGKHRGRWWDGQLPDPRRRMGGTGTPAADVLNVFPGTAYGMPATFARKDDGGRPIDPKNPPRYESEAAYLDRHGLLTDQEQRRLSKRDFEPVKVKADAD